MDRQESSRGMENRVIAIVVPNQKLHFNMTSAGSSRKRIKLEEVPASDDETAIKRKRILSEKLSQLLEVKESYYDNLTECFFLQNGGQMMDYYPWRKKPTPQLVAFLKSGRLDSDDEDDNPVVYLKESKTTEDVKSSDSGSSCLLSTPDGSQTIKTQTTIPVSHTLNNPAAIVPAMVLTGTKAVSTSQSIHRSMSDTKLLTLGSNKTPTSVSGSEKTTSPGSQKQVSYDGTVIRGISSQEAIEAQVMSRVAELRKEGLWSTRRLPKVQEPPRPKTHWDYLLEEMQWLAADFHQERKWKKTCSKKIAKMVQKHFQDIEQRELKAEKEEGMRLKRIASQMAKMVVQYKQNSRLDEKRKKAMDLHLNFIVNQTEQYSTWLSEGLTQASNSGSRNTTPDPSVAGDDEFRPDDSESDDEETIEKDEQGINEEDTMDEVAALQKESELPIESLIESLPKEILENPASIPSDSEHEEEQTTVKDKDEEFDGKEESESDVEETIEEQEEQEEKDYDAELDDLKNEGDLDIEALRAKYSAAYDDDFEMPRDSDEESTDINASEDESEEEEEETEIEEEEEADEEEDVGLEALVPEKQPKKEVKTPIPFLIKHSLREYQHVGLDWLATMYEKRLNGIWGPHLIVVPTSVMLNWEMECKKWCPAFKILTYYGSQKERKQKRTGWTKTNAFHICITSYKLVIQDHNAFRRKKWKYLILDEAQNIKNFKSQRWQCLLNFNSMRRLLLTGTPLQNSLMELWSLMHFLMPHVFQSHKDFKEWFANPLTGMIEGSHEYNENLIRRLHKVLRPFLLRRLKDDVEKQMPKKYEHVVMCHLSKRQRFLYDEFMAQGKTKETLASGHFMSVINILMQLRKVCNHPSLFDPRPIISPLQMEGLVYNTASLVLHVIKYNPLKDLDLHRYPGLAEMERDLPAFIAHRVRKLQTNRRLIEEIEVQPSPPPRPLPGKLKVNAIRSVSPAVQAGQSSPALGSRSASPAPLVKPATTASAQAPLQPAANTQNSASSAVPSSQPITVQIQHTDQGTRLVLPSSQISQLPGFIQLVQTSAGSSVPTSINISTTALVVTMASSGGKPMVSSVMSQVKMSSGIQGGAQNPVQLPMGTGNQGQKPVMRVSPLTGQHMGSDGMVFTTASTTSSTSYVISGAGKPLSSVTPSLQMIKHLEAKKKRCSQQDFFMEPLFDKKQKAKQEKLKYISRTNKNHCEKKPVYGQDLCDAVNIFKDPYSSKSYRNRDLTKWQGPGHIHCYCAKNCDQPKHPKYLWNQTSVLSDFIHTPEQYLEELQDVLERFVFATPPLQCPPITMHTSHPPPSYLSREAARDALIRSELSPRTVNYHKISTKMTVQFPELRLIQYDCGKLQTLDILLHRLKSGDHRVLIFTQMTRMLDILEAFLNYHGHRYLRLDGTTKIEARQHLMDRFNADSRIFVFILSTRSGGVGVNLTGADTVIFYDSDWNPTMDAQAQDRCHRIGQTRDVHIYRLVSERTVEENILKKANQKRMLGDMAIEGGNFTTAFFKQNTISELFTEPSGLDSLVKEKEEEEKEKQDRTSRAQRRQEQKKSDPTEQVALQQFEKALANTEDETDRVAIDHVKDEQKEELAEFDENIPWEEGDRKGEDESHVEVELAMLDKEEDIETVKKDWELNRLKALKEEEERRAEMEEDEMLYTYSRDDAYQQVKKRNRQLASEARRAAAEAQAPSSFLSPRKATLSGAGVDGDDEESKKKQWVYRTPKIIKDLVHNRNNPVTTVNDDDRKSKGRVVGFDDEEDVDVETVDMIEESGQKVKRKSDKVVVKRPRKPKGTSPAKVPKHAYSFAVCSTEATRLESLPGYSMAQMREGLLQKLHSPPKSAPDRANIFEQFGVQGPPPLVGTNVVQSPVHNPLAGSTVRLINTPQGRQMVVVNSSVAQQQQQQQQQQQSSPQNVILLQGMQGFPQGIVVGNNILSLQGNHIGQLSRPGTPVSLQQGLRIVNTQQVVNSKLGPRIVSPVVANQQQLQNQQQQIQNQQALIQRLISNQQQQLAANQAQALNPGLMPGTPIQIQQLSQQSSPPNQQVVGPAHIRLTTPLVHASGGQMVTIQSAPTAHRKSSTQTIANLIAAGKAGAPRQTPPPSPQSKLQAPQQPRPAFSIPNLAKIMRAQRPCSGTSGGASIVTSSHSQVRVNPDVAKLVASHIQNIASHPSHMHSGQGEPQPTFVSTTKAASPAVVNVSSVGVSRSQSPAIVKVVSVSRTGSPSNVSGAVKTPMTTMQRGNSPLATINIKGLPPGVSIPASLVNSLVSGSIGGISKGTIRANVPQATPPTPVRTVVKVSNPQEFGIHVNAQQASHPTQLTQVVHNHVSAVEFANVASPLRSVAPVSAASSPPVTMQAWSNPNLVIRTRRAAVKHPATPTGPAPQSPLTPRVNGPPLVLEARASPISNGPLSLGNHVTYIQQAQIPTVVKQLEKQQLSEETNGGVDVIEIN
ncbi:DOM-like protein [Mya arenaria]|uniref:DOM-like protein n=1 Tax=Mya arenaria TaxID=6604 RepID=A0ABY7DWI3_MYAAR|nr:DOM-like protein [Mya arenaria]